MPRYVFITGGVVSSLGKGIATSSLGALLQARGYKVRLRKLDPYLNIDPGTMNPFEHGEVFVTDDGAETDLDLGHYERFTGVAAKQSDNTTTGRIYEEILAREREGKYRGATVQVIPHVTNAIRDFITAEIEDVDFVLCEIGGTVGDIESLPFLEAIRQMRHEMGSEKTLFIHLTLIPHLEAVGEMKTKPTQHSVANLRAIGIQPDIIICRSARPLPPEERRKIALFCSVAKESVIEGQDVPSIYQVPLFYHKNGLDDAVLAALGMHDAPKPDLKKWRKIGKRLEKPEGGVNIAIVGKYVGVRDAYKSLEEALIHGGMSQRVAVNLKWLEAERLEEKNGIHHLEGVHAVLVPGGFGKRGTEGMISAAHFARTRRIPYLGICFGMQMAVIEIGRNLLSMKNAISTEFDKMPNNEEPLIGESSEWEQPALLPGVEKPLSKSHGALVGLATGWEKEGEFITRTTKSLRGGTMRLGDQETILIKRSLIAQIYNINRIYERHRHRYEVNKRYMPAFHKEGVVMSGQSLDRRFPEVIEIPDHPWYIGVQYHPELKSRPFEPHPLFKAFVGAALEQSRLV